MTTFHGYYGAGNLLKRHYNSVMTRGERVIAISRFIADHMARVYGAEPERVRVVPRGVDLRRFDPARVGQERIAEISRRWRLPDGVPVVMLPGRLTGWKGQTVLIDAIAQLGRADVCCVLVGDDQGRSAYRQALVRQINRRGLGAVVRLVGECNDMPAAYMLADVVISASTLPEAFGRVIAEAQAMGRPVVASDHGGARETVVPGTTGWLVPPGDAAGLAAVLGTALSLDAEKRKILADAAIAHIRTNYTVEMMCERTLEVYREVLAPATTQAEALAG